MTEPFGTPERDLDDDHLVETPSGAEMTEQPDTPIMSDTGEDGERRDVLDAMAVNSADGQADDASGNDAAAAAAGPRDSGSQPEADREPHGPS